MCFYLCCQGLSVAGPVSINHSRVIQRNNSGSKRKKQGNYKASIMEAPITAAGPVLDRLINGFIFQKRLFLPANQLQLRLHLPSTIWTLIRNFPIKKKKSPFSSGVLIPHQDSSPHFFFLFFISDSFVYYGASSVLL